MSRKLDYAEMKQIMQQYFLLLSGKRAMQGNLNMNSVYVLTNWAQVLSDFQYPNALLIDGSRQMTGDLPFKVLRGIDATSYIRTRQEDDSILDFQDWYVNNWRNIMSIYSGLIDIHSCGNIYPASTAKSLGRVDMWWWQMYLRDMYFHGRTSDPASPPEGMMWYNTTDNVFKGSVAGVIKEIVTK